MNTKRKTINIQLDTGKISFKESEIVIDKLKSFICNADENINYKIDKNQRDLCTNLSFSTENIRDIWTSLEAYINSENVTSETRESLIIVCEGKKGWDDYLLLYHYDKSQPIDEIM